MDVGRTNLFQMDIQTTELPVAWKPYPIPLKYQKFFDEEIKAVRKCRLYIQKFKPVGHSSYYSTKKWDPSNPHKQQLWCVLDYRSPNKSINMTHDGNSIISYYPLPNITDLLARLQNCTIFSSLELSSGYHHIGLTPEAKPKTAFATSDKLH